MYRALYTHVPKTGGTSIKDAVEPHKESLVVTENSSIIKKHPSMDREHILVLNFRKSNSMRKKEVLGEKVWNNLYKFAFVRNPWDRYVSNWQWLALRLGQRNTWVMRGWRGVDGHVSFASFVKQMGACYRDPYMLQPYQHDKWHIRNQLHHIIDYEGNIMLDYVGRFENLQEEFAHICKEIDLDVQLPHLNYFGQQEGLPMQKQKPHYSTYYTDELVEIVRERSQADIKAFGYEFEWK
mgnify:CR=1 FL=1